MFIIKALTMGIYACQWCNCVAFTVNLGIRIIQQVICNSLHCIELRVAYFST